MNMEDQEYKDLLEEYEGDEARMQACETKVVVERTESSSQTTTWRSEKTLNEIREDYDISYEDMNNAELLDAIKEDPDSYFDLFDGEIVHDKRKDMGIYDDVTFDTELDWVDEL